MSAALVCRATLGLFLFSVICCCGAVAGTTALWLFDEHTGLYPSSVLNDSSKNDYSMVIGPACQLTKGKYGNALDPSEPQPRIEYPGGSASNGLRPAPKEPGRRVEPLTWMNANFCGLMTSGESHLRKQVPFPNATDTKLNLGAFDWTVEFWYLPTRDTGSGGVVFEVGSGPRGENNDVTRLALEAGYKAFIFYNKPSRTKLRIPSDVRALNPKAATWHHLAFVYSVGEHRLRHYVDGKLQPLPRKAAIWALAHGDEAYFSVGRDGLWSRPLPGKIDELRLSDEQVYRANFNPPASFAPEPQPQLPLQAGPPLLFSDPRETPLPIPLGDRKYVFIDDAIVAEMQNVTFTANPPRLAGRVVERIPGHFTKHLTVVEDETALIRIYYEGPGDSLAVVTSRDGVHWTMPDLGYGEYKGARNVAIRDKVSGTGTVFIDPNAAPESRWKFIGGIEGRGIYLYTSPDGWSFHRRGTAVLPFAPGSQSEIFYDDQRQSYMGYHRSDFGRTPGGATQREFVWTELKRLDGTWDYHPVTQHETWDRAKTKRLRDPQPWYLDNGPLTPGGFGIEFPVVFAPDDLLDPVGTDIYVPKPVKYPWAPDTYVAFLSFYFHYERDGPKTRQALGAKEHGRGSGPIETQLAVSRDGVHWKRYPRPTYIGLGRHDGRDLHMIYMAQGMVRRGDEIWQYYLGDDRYHSAFNDDSMKRAVYRAVQRLDGFVSADTSYTGGTLKTKLLTFKGNHLVLNINTDAIGYAQVGILGRDGNPIPGYSLDDCIYINGDHTATEVEWLGKGKDLSALQGQPVQLVFRMRGTRLYSMQFVNR